LIAADKGSAPPGEARVEEQRPGSPAALRDMERRARREDPRESEALGSGGTRGPGVQGETAPKAANSGSVSKAPSPRPSSSASSSSASSSSAPSGVTPPPPPERAAEPPPPPAASKHREMWLE